MTGSLYIIDEAADFDPSMWENILEEYRSGKEPTVFYRPVPSPQWVELKYLEKSDDYELEKLDDSERKG